MEASHLLLIWERQAVYLRTFWLLFWLDVAFGSLFLALGSRVPLEIQLKMPCTAAVVAVCCREASNQVSFCQVLLLDRNENLPAFQGKFPLETVSLVA